MAARAAQSIATFNKPRASIVFNNGAQQLRSLATATTAKSPGTAMVFLNMGGPSTTDEVGDFLSRLFVRNSIRPS